MSSPTAVTGAFEVPRLAALQRYKILDTEPEKARKQFQLLYETANAALKEMRTLIFQLRPADLEQEGLDQVGDAGEDAAADRFGAELPEEDLDHVDPARRGRGEVQLKARVLGQPGLDAGVVVGGVVVEDQMDL